ncbi:MAG: GntR family transcriptional regulator [Phycisphaerae bacterium]|nr:GntR family transcriptional regulator [Phycisphaerae bacterium]
MATSVLYKREKLRRIILSDIQRGAIGVGDRLPTENEMVRKYRMSRATIREGIALLVQDGILIRKRGSGTYVKSHNHKRENELIAALVGFNPEGWDNAGQIVHEIERRVHDQGGNLVLCNHAFSAEKASLHLDKIIQQNVAGVVFSPIQIPGMKEFNHGVVRKLEDNSIPFVLIGSPISEDTLCRYSFVSTNGFEATRQIVRHLLRVGHRRIAYIQGFSDVFSANERFNGYLEETRRHGLEIPDGYVQAIQVGQISSQGRDEIHRILSCDPKPTAVICIHDMIARNVMEEVGAMGMNVPGDLAVVGFDDLYFAGELRPPLTTVRTPLQREAAENMKILYQKIHGTLIGERQEFLSTRLIVRESCGAPPELRGEFSTEETERITVTET